MSEPAAAPRSMLVLAGAKELPALARAFGGPVVHAASAEEASRTMQEEKPALVVAAQSEWHREFLSSLSPEVRPAVLGIGAEADASIADEWLSPDRDEEEGAVRLRLAQQRARTRRLTARRAFVDFLTGLPNRRASVRALVREAERSRRSGGALSLVLIDLDDFKRVNDEKGHPAGDRLLRKVGGALRSVTRGSELCGRVGGDEFALIISGDRPVALNAAGRSREALRALGVSATMAACTLRRNESLRELYRRTDRELTAAKERRRAQVGAGASLQGRPPAHLTV
ncbi:MAG: GGDEF domain-containing protein [Myxococcales bacterium]|nr:GGDEF domain-containing protein [Myxococcales bacterium]